MLANSRFAPWADPAVVELQRLSMRPPLVISNSLEDVRVGRAHRRKMLDGVWRLLLVRGPDAVAESDLRGRSAALGKRWHHVAVPGNWTLQDVGDLPHYTNIDMPFDGPPPCLPINNPTGIYRRTVSVPATWLKQQVVLHLGAADSVHMLYVNGKFAGYGTDNRLASEYDVTHLVRAGDNEVAVVVVRYSAQSYVEDQDQWWMAGLHRSVFIEARSPVHVRSVECSVDYDHLTATGSATVTTEVAFIGEPAAGVSVQMWFEELSGKKLCEPVICDVPHRYAKRYVFAGHRATAEFSIPNVRAWSAEDPHRYRLIIKLIQRGLAQREFTSLVTGFRRVRVEAGEVRVNGQRITIRGVNRHDHHPERGKAVTRNDMLDDVLAMKRHNCNAVRTSHYPNDPVLLDLCDEHGLYVVGEANIESHAYNTSLCDDERFLATWLARGARMVVRDRHHPSVIFWSLGNESGFGINHDALAALVRSLDPTRPLHYEGAIFHARNGETEVWRNGGRYATDVVCPMYPSIQAIVEYARSGADRPLVMCEYSHAMGNSNGSLADYWAAVESEPLLAGGFVWEWKDHGLRQSVDITGKDSGKVQNKGKGRSKSANWRYAYGGQFGDTPNDGNFVADGVNAPDLTPHPVMRELAWAYRPVAVTASGTTQFVVHNRQSHVGLCALRGTLSVLVAGTTVHEEAVDIDVPALQQATCNMSSTAMAAIEAAKPSETITVQFRWTQRTETAYAPAGHLVAWDEIEVRVPQSKNNFVDTAVDTDVATGASTHQLPADSDFSAPIRLALMRATIDNDGYKVMPGFGEAHHIGGRALARWTRQGILADTIPQGVQHVQRRKVQSDSSVVYHHRVVVPEPLTGLPRVGVRFSLSQHFTHVRWFGRGPHENYPDRNASAMRDVWAREPDELPYVVPQEFGLRTDCEWIEFVAQDRTLRIDALSPATLHFSAVHYTPLQLFEALDVTQLERSKHLVVHLDVAHRGLGTASCGPDVDPRYEVAAGTYEFSYVVRRI